MFGHKEYEFTQEFTSPSLGNVYLGKKLFMNPSQGQKFVAAGLAREVKEVQKAKVTNDGRGNAGGGKGASKGNAK